MDEGEIEVISSSQYVNKVAAVLQSFLKHNGNQFSFPSLNAYNNRAILWTALFQHLQNKKSEEIHSVCLAVIRVLSRDKTDLESLLCEKWITTLIERAGLYNYDGTDDNAAGATALPNKDVMVEALKCLCNLTYNSEAARAHCANTSISQGLVARLKVYKELSFKDDIMLFDMKLMFILTALRQDIKLKIKNELHGMEYLTNCLSEIILESSYSNECGACKLTDQKQAIVCDILKAQFNLIIQTSSEEPENKEDDAMFLKLMPVITRILCAQTTTTDKSMELKSNIANLLTGVPPKFYSYLTPELEKGESSKYSYNGSKMDAIHFLLDFLQHRLTITSGTHNQYENLSPILTVLNKSSRGCRMHRKYLRQEVLPPLRDVSKPPEKGNTLRNQLCRLLTTPVTSVRDLVAEFLFILCKEKVGRMVKYTGFGNAAGHLAQKGLMGGGGGGDRGRGVDDGGVGGDPYSSSSDDSDTEEYLQAAPHIDPVVGCTRPPRTNPFEGMSDEQKEYEAMKLVKLFDKLVSDGVMKPARVGPDGRPQAVEHVLELRDPPNRTNS